MAHHSSEPPPDDFLPDDAPETDLDDVVGEMRPDDSQDRRASNDESPAFGATGRHPEGRLTDEDEGEIRFGVISKNGKVVIDFGKPVHWFAATPEQAKDLAGSLLNKAREATK